MIGIDMVEIKRFDKLLLSKEFLAKTFVAVEQEYINSKLNKSETASGIFACKEAFLKAIGVGILNKIALTDIVVNHLQNGKPVIAIPASVIEEFSIINADVSISHDGGFAVAICDIISK